MVYRTRYTHGRTATWCSGVRELDATTINTLESWRATERLGGMSQAFNVAHAASDHGELLRASLRLRPRRCALPSARSAPCLPPLASGPLSEGPTAERPPRSSSSRRSTHELAPTSPDSLSSSGPRFPPLSLSLSLSLTLAFPVRYPHKPLSLSLALLRFPSFPTFPFLSRRISVVFFSISLHSVSSSVASFCFSLFFFVFSYPDTLRSCHGSARRKKFSGA